MYAPLHQPDGDSEADGGDAVMCGGGSSWSWDDKYLHDMRRGRLRDYNTRFREIGRFAHSRWSKARNLRHALFWQKVEEEAKAREWL